MTKTLTDRFVAGIRSESRENVFDTKTRGLVLRISPKAKTWYFTYRHGGPTQWLRLGEYPALSLADARGQATAQRKALEVDGIDPAAERRKPVEPEPTPRAFTFEDFVPTYVAFQKGRTKEWEDEQSKIHRHLLPVWGPIPLRDIKRAHVHELLDTIVGKGLTTGVNRIQALISRMFTVALDRGLVDAHPASRLIKRFQETPRDRVLSDAEICTLWAGLDAHPGAASDAVRLRLLLGQRGGETVGMGWSEVDLDTALWVLPASRTKHTQTRNKKPHSVPLPPQALALLKRRRTQLSEDEPRVFPDLSLTGDEHKALAGLHGGKYEWKDLRRTVGTRLAELGYDETTRGRVLNHARYSVTDKHYNAHEYDDEKRQALTAWDAELTRILAHEPRKRPRVLPMRRR
jgi:integrase